MTEYGRTLTSAPPIWVVVTPGDDDPLGRIGDARELAEACGSSVEAIFVGVREPDPRQIDAWVQGGADAVRIVLLDRPHQASGVAAVVKLATERPPRLVLTAFDRDGRAFAARLAARTDWPLVEPVLLVRERAGRFVIAQLDSSGRQTRAIELTAERPVIVGIAPGVAQPLLADTMRSGVVERMLVSTAGTSRWLGSERVPADPAVADIRHLPKLIAGGRGVGSREGFEVLRRVARALGAGVAASRMAVDLGWIEPDRQVGQTGKTVSPALYIACGIHGASHHWDGMSDSQQIVAINTDAEAPLMQRGQLSIQADLHATLGELLQLLEARA
jgi:electron transfer flavoprotein alpha subunit